MLAWKLLILAGLVATVLLTAVGIVAMRRAGSGRRPRTSGAEQEARRRGFVYTARGDKQFRARFAHLGEVPRGATIKHVMAGHLDGRPAVFFEATYMVSTGQMVVPVAHTIYTVESPAWPATHVTPRNLFWRLAVKLGRQPRLAMENPAFNLRFKLKTDDDDFAIALLSPEMQEFMLTKTTARWRIVGSRVCLIYAGTLKSSRMESSLQRMRGFWELVAPELEAW